MSDRIKKCNWICCCKYFVTIIIVFLQNTAHGTYELIWTSTHEAKGPTSRDTTSRSWHCSISQLKHNLFAFFPTCISPVSKLLLLLFTCYKLALKTKREKRKKEKTLNQNDLNACNHVVILSIWNVREKMIETAFFKVAGALWASQVPAASLPSITVSETLYWNGLV